ncbi:MAG: aromatic-ring-hydroxylating dioxygenase subunit beta [Burkholderiaceae bacterium]
MTHDSVRELIARSCLALDEERFSDYLDLCADDYRYRILAHSTEIDREMTWLDVDRQELAAMFEMIPQHVRMQGRMRRHVSVYTVVPSVPGRLAVRSSLVVHFTNLDGETSLFAVGEFRDVVGDSAAGARLLARDVFLDTRVLGAGSHMPI